MPFIHDDFLLTTDAARRLYHDFAVGEPILDYHSHLPPGDVAEDRRFADLTEIWLEGDHYKWRAMRAAGVDERFITGDAPPAEKFLAWAQIAPQTLRNPLYHWTHLELARYFGIDELLDVTTAEPIWQRANFQLANEALTARDILKKFDVRVVCTTDDPAETLDAHEKIAASGLSARIYPTYRPDKALAIDQPQPWNDWLDRLAATADTDIRQLPDLLDALRSRHSAFHVVGCRLSDHGLPFCYADDCTDNQASAIFDKVRGGTAASPDEHARFASYLMHFFGHLDAEKGWTKQLHLGPLRNTNTRMFETLGPDVGCDSIGDFSQAAALARYLDRLDRSGVLPKMILYNNNPVDNYVFATMIGNFQDGRTAGKLQLGSGWWHLDQKDGMERQLNTLSAVGLLPRFVGMLTDSRSFMSFPRHEYFRRILCNLLGRDMELGELPCDFPLVGEIVQHICFQNAKEYLGLECDANEDEIIDDRR